MNNILGYVFLCAIIVLFALLVPNGCSIANRIQHCKIIYCDRMKKRDLQCCILVMFMCIIFICTLAFGDYKDLANYISFAGTITSIILSVLAIIMTLLAEANNNEAKIKMDNHISLAEKLNTKTSKNIKHTKKLVKTLKNKEEEYKAIIDKLEYITNNQKDMQTHISQLEDSINKPDLHKQSDLFDSEEGEDI